MLEPIVILGMPRSGTSLTAGLFALHGVWTGRCQKGDNYNPTGHFENLDLKEEIIRRFGRRAQMLEPAPEGNGFRSFVERIVPKDKKWLMKLSAMYRSIWSEFSPKFVCVRRNREGIIGSNLKTGFFGTRDITMIHKLIDAHEEQMDLSGGVNVYVDKLIEGDLTSLGKAMEYCEISPDLDKIEAFVEPSYWKRWSR